MPAQIDLVASGITVTVQIKGRVGHTTRVVRSHGIGSTGGGGPTLFGASGTVAKKNKGIGGVMMSFSVTSGTGQAPASVLTASDGAWIQSGFQAGTAYRVTPSMEGFRFSPGSREFSEAAVDLNFKRKK